MSARPVLFVCDDAAEPAWLANRAGMERRAIRSRGADADLDLHIDSLPLVLNDVVSSRAADLLRIAAYAYRADTALSRGRTDDVSATRWKRDITLCIPVADPAFWNDPARKVRLTSTLEFATGDAWDLAFSAGEPVLRPLQPSFYGQSPRHRARSVVLFSGGIDSLCALLEAAMNGDRPIAVGHWSASPHAARQRDLVSGACAAGIGAWDFPLVGIRIHRHGAERAENSQRTRAFLFASLGAIVAAESGVERVYLADNGPVSINLPINDQLVGALASRSTHPKFLHLFNAFVADLFPTPVRVSNPHAFRTRAEVMQLLKDANCQHLLPRTLSCSAWSRLPAITPQCGVCSQCIDRRVAAIAAGLEEWDPGPAYRTDALTADLTQWQAQTVAESYVRFAKRVRGMDNDQLFASYPQLRDVVVPGDADPEATMLAAVDLVKRHATMVRDGLKRAMADRLDRYLDTGVASTSLLRLAGEELGEAGARRPASSGLAATPVHAQAGTDVGPTNALTWMGGAWHWRYLGDPVVVDPLKGMDTIALLLAHPRTPYTAADIEAELGAIDDRLRARAGDVEPDGMDGEQYGGGGDKTDYPAIKEYRAALADLDEEIAAAERDRDIERVAELKIAREHYVVQLREGMKPGGRLEVFADNLTKQHDRVSRGLRRTLDNIHKKHPALARHLHDAIKRRSDFTYAPEPNVIWEVHLPAA